LEVFLVFSVKIHKKHLQNINKTPKTLGIRRPTLTKATSTLGQTQLKLSECVGDEYTMHDKHFLLNVE
jgi:hypothetical protein